jgi:hypothetical protein
VTLAARSSGYSLVVHAVDDAGALCGARPGAGGKRGDWRLSRVLPVNCPRCLHALATKRWAICETVTAGSASPLHIRLVGPEGINTGGHAVRARTLCGMEVGWDLAPLKEDDLTNRRTCRGCRLSFRNS